MSEEEESRVKGLLLKYGFLEDNPDYEECYMYNFTLPEWGLSRLVQNGLQPHEGSADSNILVST